MTKHFENRAAAVADLRENGFQRSVNWMWVNSVCVASIHPTHSGDIVAVTYREIENQTVSA